MPGFLEYFVEEGFEQGRAEGRREGIKQGREEGISQGISTGQEMLSKLNLRLLEEKRYEELERMARDKEYREELFRTYDIYNPEKL